MRIVLVTPRSRSRSIDGNSITARRYMRILRQLGHRVTLVNEYQGEPSDLLVALHAFRSHSSIAHFAKTNPGLPIIVVLTGTDLYRDIRTRARAKESLRLATRLVALQPNGKHELEPSLLSKTRVIYQSADTVRTGRPPISYFRIALIGNIRPEKDPFRAALAVRHLPSGSRVRIIHAGRAMTEHACRRALRETRLNPRYQWVGELSHGRARRLIADSHLFVITSRMEGSSNAMMEALSAGVPVIASQVSGLEGTLGSYYQGYFPVGDTDALRMLILRAESDKVFYKTLQSHCRELSPLVRPEAEREAWRQLLAELEC